MHKRTFMGCVALAILATPLGAAAQASTKIVRLGFLSGGARTPDGLPPRALRDNLRELGYIEGQNISYVSRFAEGQADRLGAFAAELVGLKVDVIGTQGGPAAMAAKQATSSIPIVMTRTAGDAVAAGLIASLARPGGNVTGLTDESVQLSAKRMELLKEAVPKAAVIAVLWNTNDQGMTLRYQQIEKAARALKVEVQALPVRRPDDFAEAFSAMAARRPDAMFLVADGLTTANRQQIIDFAAKQRIPAMYEFDFLVRDGGLMSYGPSVEDDFRRAAVYINRVLKGARPSDLPAEQPTRYYLGLNLKTAAALGLAVPPTLLFRADHIVQ